MKLSRKALIVWIIILLALIVGVATVSAAELSAVDTVASVDVYSAEGLFYGTISATGHQLISPWAIDVGRSIPIF